MLIYNLDEPSWYYAIVHMRSVNADCKGSKIASEFSVANPVWDYVFQWTAESLRHTNLLQARTRVSCVSESAFRAHVLPQGWRLWKTTAGGSRWWLRPCVFYLKMLSSVGGANYIFNNIAFKKRFKDHSVIGINNLVFYGIKNTNM